MTARTPEENAADLPAEDRGRADLYRLLGNLLAAPPKQSVLDVLQQLPVVTGEHPSELEQALHRLREAASTAVTTDLEAEYFALFIGLGRGELSPYASWYLTGYLMEQPLAELRSDLRRLGFARRQDVAEPEDHAAALCEVMGMIISESVLSLAEQQVFFERHLRSWLPRFFEDLVLAGQADFYRTVGRTGQAFMKIERRFFAMPA